MLKEELDGNVDLLLISGDEIKNYTLDFKSDVKQWKILINYHDKNKKNNSCSK